jgi:asparagine synthetase B (glutamine-hydrolysing)
LELRPLTIERIEVARPETLEDYCRLGRSLRGQFAICLEAGSKTVAITDPFGCYPLFFVRKESRFHVASRFSDLVHLSARNLNRSALYSYVSTSGFTGEETLYTDIRRVPPATVAIFEGNRVESQTYLSWADHIRLRTIGLPEAQEEFVRLGTEYLQAIISAAGRPACFVSSGSDSALLVRLLSQNVGSDVACFTADYAIERYSEYQVAAQNALKLGCSTCRVLVGWRDYLDAVPRLNGRNQDAPCVNSTCFIFYALLRETQKEGITIAVTGDHADALFLGFEEAFRPIQGLTPGEIEKLSIQQKIEFVLPRPRLASWQKRLLQRLSLSQKDCDDWLEAMHTEAVRRMLPFAEACDLFTLQQILGQVDAGIPWQHNFLPLERETAIRFVSPFYDMEMTKFALSLPPECKWSNGRTKVLLREVLRSWLGQDLAKRAAPVPLRLWTLAAGPFLTPKLCPELRRSYVKACLSNYLGLGRSYGEVNRLAALGMWLRAYGVTLDTSSN